MPQGVGGGRPTKLHNEMLQKLPELISMGLSDNKIAEIFQISQSSIAGWKKNNPKFLIAYNLERLKADEIVEKSLFKRAIGLTVKEKRTTEGGRGTTVTEIEREVPGDVEAAKFWLANRRPESWKAKPENVINMASLVRIENSDNTKRADIHFQTASSPGEDLRLEGEDTDGS